jgi:hypothetical protein
MATELNDKNPAELQALIIELRCKNEVLEKKLADRCSENARLAKRIRELEAPRVVR